MKYALVVIEKPTSHAGLKQKDWSLFVNKTQSNQPISQNSSKCSENTWLLSLENDTDLLAKVLTAAQENELSHRVFYFQDEPVEYSYEPHKY